VADGLWPRASKKDFGSEYLKGETIAWLSAASGATSHPLSTKS